MSFLHPGWATAAAVRRTCLRAEAARAGITSRSRAGLQFPAASPATAEGPMLRRPLASSRLLPWLGLAVAAPAFAHHSIAGVYDSTRTTTVAGRVTEFRFVNPHPILVIDAAAEGEPPELWLLEMDNRFELTRIGIAADTYR